MVSSLSSQFKEKQHSNSSSNFESSSLLISFANDKSVPKF